MASSSDSVDVEQLAIIADKIVEVAPPPTVAVCSATPVAHTVDSRIGELQAQVNQLTTLVQGLVASTQQDRRSRSRDRSSNRKTGRNRSQSRQSNDTPRTGSECWYNWRFGNKATKCVKPCSFESNQSHEN